ncbi:unnamed protein product [Orchesella dallaii]|uniref:Uncharacterized protein n=1 Tax=Orchesella dallaii TaxID=48710 RepID=A0ABP1Q1G1_9HEXA
MDQNEGSLKDFKNEDHNHFLHASISEPILIQTQRPPRRKLRRATSDSNFLPSNSFSSYREIARAQLSDLDFTGTRDLPRFGSNSITVFFGEALFNFWQAEDSKKPAKTSENPDHPNNTSEQSPIHGWTWHLNRDDDGKDKLGTHSVQTVRQNTFVKRIQTRKQLNLKRKKKDSIIPKKYELRNPDRQLSKITAASSRISHRVPDSVSRGVPPKKKIRWQTGNKDLDPGDNGDDIDDEDDDELDYQEFPRLPQNERDEQWMYNTGSDISQEEGLILDAEEQKYGRKLSERGESRSDKFMEEMNLFFKILMWSGRLPFGRKRYRNFTRFSVRDSCWNYRIFCVTSIFMTILAGLMLSNFLLIYNQNPKTMYRKIEALEFYKYWVVGLFTLLNLWHVTITSLYTIFTGSYSKAEFFTRWNVCSNLLDYDTSYRIKYTIKREIIFTLTYTMILIFAIVFLDWNGAFGFISMLILRPWISHYRISKHYKWLRVLGFFVHLYSIFSARMTTVMILLYCRALENAARLFNSRLVEGLGAAENMSGKGKIVVQKRLIPYRKLLAEHVTITTFARQFGSVFAVRLTVLIIIKAFTMLVASYSLLRLLDGGYMRKSTFKTDHVEGIGKEVEPIKYNISLGTAAVILGVLIVFSWATFYHVSECLHSAGDAIMMGLDHIRRHGLILCKTSNERRFIMTMENSFFPKNDYYITCGFKINRQFINSFLAVLLSYSLMIQGFAVQKMEGQEILLCDDGGECRKTVFKPHQPGSSPGETLTEENDDSLLAVPGFPLMPTMNHSMPPPLQRSDAPIKTMMLMLSNEEFTIGKFRKDYMYQCPSITDGQPIDRLRMIFQRGVEKDSNYIGNDYAITQDLSQKSTWCESKGRPFWDIVMQVDDNKLEELKYGSDVNWRKLCYYSDKMRDDCANPDYRLPDKNGMPVDPTLELVNITLTPVDEASKKEVGEGKWTFFFCCFEWEGYRSRCGLALTSSGQASMAAQKKYVEERCGKKRDQHASCKGSLDNVTSRCYM